MPNYKLTNPASSILPHNASIKYFMIYLHCSGREFHDPKCTIKKANKNKKTKIKSNNKNKINK